jgi:hypothetical protein
MRITLVAIVGLVTTTFCPVAVFRNWKDQLFPRAGSGTIAARLSWR